MDSNKALEGDFDFRKMKSLSLVTFPKRKKDEPKQFHPPRNRCLSYAFPKDFVPHLHPKRSQIKPTPIVLNSNKKSTFELKKIEEKMSLSFEREKDSSSFDDSSDSDDEYAEIRLNIKETKPKYFILRKQMSKFTINKSKKCISKDDTSLKCVSPSEYVFNKQEKENYIHNHFKSFRHTFDCFNGKKCQRGFSIMNILEMTSGLK